MTSTAASFRMQTQPFRDEEEEFKDYYYVLDVDPDADGAEIDQSYWRLARLANHGRITVGSLRITLDELNEAYTVLGSGKRRVEYDQLRDETLGRGAPPRAPEAKELRPRVPLSVMEKQRLKPREQAAQEQRAGVLPRVWRALTSRQGLIALATLVTLGAVGGLILATILL